MKWLFLIAVLVWGTASAGEMLDVRLDTKTTVLSKNINRGVVENDEAVTKSEILLGWENFSLKFTGITALTDEFDAKFDADFIAIDFKVGDYLLERNSGKLRSSYFYTGIVYDDYLTTDREGTTELLLGNEIKLEDDFKLTTELKFDIDETWGLFLDCELSKEIDIGDIRAWSRDFSASITPELGFSAGSPNNNNYYYDVNKYGLIDWRFGINLMISDISGKYKFGPVVQYNSWIDNNIRQTMTDDEHITAGFVVRVKF